MHPTIKYILTQLESANLSNDSITLYNDFSRGMKSGDIIDLINILKGKSEYKKQIKRLSITDIDLRDVELDLSVFSDAEEISLKFCSLTIQPVFVDCKQVKKIVLNANQLTELPTIANLPQLKFLSIENNPLSQNALAEAKAKSSKTRGGLQISTQRFTDHIRAIKIDSPSSFELAYLQNADLTELMAKFAEVVDKPKNTDEQLNKDLIDMTVVAIAFLNKIKLLKDNKDPKLDLMLKRCHKNALLQTHLKYIMKYCREYVDGAGAGGTINFFFDEEIMQNHLMSNDVWLPDLSFLSGMDQLQKSLGKERDGDDAPLIVPKGLAASMGFSFWQGDRDIPYLSPEEKKFFKLRHSSEEPPYVLNRRLDEKKGYQYTPDGKYIYALSMHGGLVAASVERYQDELSITNHSAFRAGQYVACAGELHIKGGKITDINYISGHMAPSDMQLYCSIAYLRAQKYIDDDCRVTTYTNAVVMPGNEVVITVGDLLADVDKFVAHKEVANLIKDMQKTFSKKVHRNRFM